MGKRNRRRANVLDAIRDIIGSDSIDENDPFIQSLIDAGGTASEEKVPLAASWGYAFSDFLDDLPDGFVTQVRSMFRNATVQINQVFPNMEIHGTVVYGDEPAQVFVCLQPENDQYFELGCNCCELEKNQLCRHVIKFLLEIDNQLGQRSKLSNQVNKERFTKGTPDRKPYRHDQSQKALRQLATLAKHLPNHAGDNVDQSELPPADQSRDERIAWAFTNLAGRLVLEPKIQQRKKRGGGFTKGRKISLGRLVSERDLPLSDLDEQLVRVIEIGDHYYRESAYHIDPADALSVLAGQDAPNVTLDDTPLVVQRGAPVMLLKEAEPGQLKFAFENPWDATGSHRMITCSSERGFACVDPALGRAQHAAIGNSSRLAIHQLLDLAPFDREVIDKVLDHLQSIRPYVSIKIPEEFSGPMEPESSQSVVILRSHTDGKLDYGIRVRTQDGTLKLPGASPLVRSEKRDGKYVQLVRDGQHENEQATTLARQLGLRNHDANWFGTVDDLETGLRLIEKMQTGEVDAEVLWDKQTVKPITVLGSLSSNNVKVDIGTKRNWFGITGECKVGDTSLPLDQLLSQLPVGDQTIGDFVQLNDGGWARIGEQLRKRLLRLRDATHTDRKTLKLDATAAPAVRDLMDQDVEVKATKAWEKCLKRLAVAEKIQPEVPGNLDADLREYQVDGYKWLSRLAAWGVGGVLADDMGLGKTLQTLAVLLDRASDGPALVIAPTSVGFNWAREAERFAPDLQVHLYRDTERADFLPSVGPGTLVVCSYGLALRDAEALASVDWNTLVLDEAQAIKNSRSKTSKAIATIDADWTVALTGTPVENHLGELWSLFHVVSPGVFGGWEQFRNRFATPIEKQNDADSRDALASRIQPFVLRRTKSEVLTDLPPRTESNLYVELSPAERAEYEKVRLEALGEIDVIQTLPNVQDQRFKILALMTRLRQIACHPKLANKSWKESSAKLDQLCETLESLREEGHRALVFSQFTSHLGLIKEALDEREFTYEYLDGSTPPKARQEAVDRFQDGDANAFLISLKAGGTGLNLTAADYVIHMDPWWNPAVEDQATDRAHRYGQDKPVIVYRIVAKGTIEEEILALHDSKRDLVEGVMQGTQAAAKLTNEDLIKMLREN